MLILISIGFYIYILLKHCLFYEKAELSITRITFENVTCDRINYKPMYGLTTEDEEKLRPILRRATIDCEFKNLSPRKTLYLVGAKYSDDYIKSKILIGKRLSMNTFDYPKIRPGHTANYILYALINPEYYSDAELLEKLKQTKIEIIAGTEEDYYSVSEPCYIKDRMKRETR